MSFKEVLNNIDDQNIRAITPEEAGALKECLLEMYLDIQSVCSRYRLNIMLVGGSLLGAIRHKGYIPWDDDFDAGMYREDFEKFKTIFDEEFGDRYFLDAPNTGEKASNRFPKILLKNTKLAELGTEPDDPRACIKIDLFIIENVPKMKAARLLHGFLCTACMFAAGQVSTYENDSERMREFFYSTDEGRKTYKRRLAIGKAFGVLPGYKWFNIVDSVCRYNRKTGLMGIPTGRKHYFGEILPAEVFFPASKGMFEGKEVTIPGNPDAYLKNLYGDYMKIPDEEHREKHMIYLLDFGDWQQHKDEE